MGTELQSLWQLLCGKYGWSPAILSYIGLFRTGLKFFSARIQTNLTARMVAAAQSYPDGAIDEDARDFDELLKAKWYRMTNFILDLVFSFKLPTHADFLKAKALTGQVKTNI